MKVLIVPKGANPYQELLYSELRTHHPSDRFRYVVPTRLKFPFYPFIFLFRRLQGYKILHLHWNIFIVSHTLPLARVFSHYYTIFCLAIPKMFGCKIVWTVHEITPNWSWAANEVGLAQWLSRAASAKIVHSESTIDDMREAGLDVGRTFLIPHGNYVGVYPDTITREEARQRLGIATDDFVVLFFGTIHPYKGLDDLLELFARTDKQNLRLLIAGACQDEAILARIDQAKKTGGIAFHNGHVEDDDVATYFRACDVVCLPFQKITTSGSAMLALSFGKPIITPRIGAQRDLPDTIGFLYDPGQVDGLEQSLRSAIDLGCEGTTRMHGDVVAHAEAVSWSRIAEDTYRVYEMAATADDSARR